MRKGTVAWTLGAAALVLSTLVACAGRSGGNAHGSSDAGESGLRCTQSVGGGSSGGSTCSMTSTGTCSDGTQFGINCSCPAATCTCTRQTSSPETRTSYISIACPQACSQVGADSFIQACNFGSDQGLLSPPPDAGLPACTIPASMEPPQPNAWSVGRAYLDCEGSGLTTVCLSDDGTTCAGNVATTVGDSCTDKCAPDEYAVAYEYGAQPAPPLAGCTGDEPVSPGGGTFACCPCQ